MEDQVRGSESEHVEGPEPAGAAWWLPGPANGPEAEPPTMTDRERTEPLWSGSSSADGAASSADGATEPLGARGPAERTGEWAPGWATLGAESSGGPSTIGRDAPGPGGPSASGGVPGRQARRGRKGVAVVAVAAVALVAAGVGAVVGTSLERGTGSASTGGTSSSATTPTTAGSVSSNSLDVQAIAKKVDPALVDITTVLGYQNGEAAGTGMILTSSGEVLTNNHVVDGGTKITAQIDGKGRVYQVKVLGVDPTDDVALLQLEGASGLQTVHLGNSASVAVGEPVVAIGNALDLPGAPTVTEGIISALGRTINASDAGSGLTETLHGMLQTDAPINPGNSGGPLLDSAGQVIGMNTAAASGSSTQSASNIGFAIPINRAAHIASEIRAGDFSGSIERGSKAFLGVEVESPSVVTQSGQAGSPFGGFPGFGGAATSPTPATSSGAYVVEVLPDTAASSSGLAAGDVITGVDGKTVTSPSQLSSVLGTLQPGAKAQIRWVTPSDQTEHATVTLGSGPIG
jgi:S1-C subfamily serine protease